METEDNAIDKMFRMMDKFETLCCGGDNCPQRINQGNYTDFSVNEILKPDFGARYINNCYFHKIADIVSSTDELSDVTSEYDDRNSSEYEFREASSPDSQCLPPSSRRRKTGYVPDDPLFQHSYVDVKPFSILERIRRNKYLEEDGYSSSDSESALDLRIPRKKTPPKNSVPAWVFCTRYSDRPSAGE